MARRSENAAIYLAGVVQGVALVTFPAASTVFTNASYYGLTSTEYGGMFVPQAVTAICSSLLGAGLSRRLGLKRVYLAGLLFNLLAMALLVLSRFVMGDHGLAYGILLIATACLGTGFGFTVPALNTMAAAFFPQTVDKALLGLNALLGLGTVLAPVFVALFVGLGLWWGLPVLVGGLILALLLFSAGLPLNASPLKDATNVRRGRSKIPSRFWLFAAFALVYGVCETMNGNWASLYMTKRLAANATLASLALTAFWAAVTIGRILVVALETWLPSRRTCLLLPWIVAGAFVVAAVLPQNRPLPGIATFVLAGLGCSALLPLILSFGQTQLPTMAGSVAGGLIAFYQIGYGIAAFGVGPLQTWASLGLNVIYGGATIFALTMGLLAVFAARGSVQLVT